MAAYLEYLTSNSDIAFPFSDDAPGLDSGVFPRDAVIDASMTMSGGARKLYLLGSGAAPGDSSTWCFRVGDAEGVLAHAELPAGELGDRRVVRFENLDAGIVLRGALVLGPGASSAALSGEYGLTLPFTASVTEFRAPRVERINFKDSSSGGDMLLSGPVRLLAGTNMRVAVEKDYIDNDCLALSALAGAGAGAHDPCTDSSADYIATINKVGPGHNGLFRLDGGVCHTVAADFAGHALALFNECDPCCQCSDYVDMADELSRRSAVMRDVEARFQAAVEYYAKLSRALRAATCSECCMAQVGGLCVKDASEVTATASRNSNPAGSVKVFDEKQVRISVVIDNSLDSAPKPDNPEKCVRTVTLTKTAGTAGRFLWAGASPEQKADGSGYGVRVSSMTSDSVVLSYRAYRKTILKATVLFSAESTPASLRMLTRHADGRSAEVVVAC